MPRSATLRPSQPLTFRPTYRGFLRFCDAVGYQLAPFQKRIARAHFGAEREAVAILPRGSAKSTLAAHLATHHVLSRRNPGVYVGAGCRDQARDHRRDGPALAAIRRSRPHVVWRTDALRWA